MSASISNAQNPPIATSTPAAPANSKISPSIASSAAPVVVGQHGKSSSISPVNGSNPIKPAVPAVPAAMGPAIVNSSGANGEHSRKSSVTISAAGTSGSIPNGGPVVSSRAPSNLTFGSLAGSPAPSHAAPHNPQNLNPQAQNPRINSPAHSPTPIPAPIASGGKPDTLTTRPNLVFGGSSDSAESNARPMSMPPQQHPQQPQAHFRQGSNQSTHSESNRAFQNNSGRGRGSFQGGYPQMGHPSPQPQFRAMNNPPRGPMPPNFQPGMHHPNSPYRQNRSPALTPAVMHQQAMAAQPGMPFYPGQQYPQVRNPSNFFVLPTLSEFSKPTKSASAPRRRFPSDPASVKPTPSMRSRRNTSDALTDPSSPLFSFKTDYNAFLTQLDHQMNYMPQQQLGADPYGQYYGQNYPQPYGNMGQSMYAPGGIPPSPRNHYQMPYGQAPPQAQGMARSNSNMSESRPQSAVAQPSTPAISNVGVSHTHTPSVPAASPAPSSSTFAIPSKSKSKAIVIKTSDGKVVDFKSDKKPASPAPSAASIVQPKSPAIVATPTPPPRPESTHSRAESIAAKTDSEKKADFVLQFKKQLEAEKSQKEADEKKAKEEEAAAIAQKEKEEQAAKVEAEKAAKEKADAEAAKKAEEEAAEKKRLDDEEMERMIADMEREAAEEEAREKAFQEKKKIADAERAAKEAKEADERLKAAEREAEDREAKKGQGGDDEAAKLFASLKKNTQFGPSAGQDSAASTPTPEPASTPIQPKLATAKAKPHPLKLETTKAIEPAQPTAGMTSLKSARFLAVKNEVNYPEGVRSPNPALNQGGKSKTGRPYDMSFLLQFQNVFKEKPSVDWDMKLKETVGDTDSARPQSARTPSMGGRASSSRGLGIGPMGSFQGGAFPNTRTLPPGTTSEERFRQASSRGGVMPNPLAQFGPGRAGGAGGFPVQMARTSSFQNMGSSNGPNSPRVGSSRGRGSRRGDKPSHNNKDEKAMPLTAGMQIRDLTRSTTGWQPMSRTELAAQQAASGHMAPDMVQRKVKAALNKMTPEKFDKIADQILEIAGQSKNEQDGRTLRQVIQLTFEKACDEQHWSSMYAKFCAHMLNTMSTDIRDENVRDKHDNPVVGGALFRKYLLNRCQEEFEKGWEINLPEKPEGQSGEAALLSEDYYIAAAAKRRGLGLIQFIGELYKLNMLTLRIMHECVLKLLDFEGLPDESAVESLTKLLRTVGGTMATADAGPKMLDVYFQRIEKIMNMEALNSRLKFMLMDLCDLRRNNWVSKDAGKGPMTLQEIHAQAVAAQQQAEMERQRTNNRGGPRSHMGRGDARSFSGGGMPPPQDYPTGRVQMDDLRKLSKGASGRNPGGALGPSMLGNRSGSGRRGLGPGGALMGRGDDSGSSSRAGTPAPKDKEPTNANSFSALMSLDNEGAGEVGSPPSTTGSPPQSKAAISRSKSPATAGKPSE
ncbi:hypothetical protein P280DRAFT_535591 [Massarina eburnea CBS 473.64]|uniref:MIF4G domain-containing protein n=1 Tax=Massarina eburnea CBS 473.64 TaxID=1395130 RepID=A0A6A6SDG5_9PLEO|nr:hypothetical protein P280DRAFT_535591 [Massarina eburnea CBS 473.64]